MVRGILFFLMIWAFIGVGIRVFNAASGNDKIGFIKEMAYAGACAVLASIVVFGMVIAF